MQSSGIDLNSLGTVPLYKLGQVYKAPTGEEYRYVKGSASIALYEWSVISKDGNYTAVLLDTDTSGHGAGTSQDLGVPQHQALTSTTYGWVFIGFGAFTGKVAASCVQNVPLHATSTGGVVDDTSTTTLIPGATLLTTVVGAAASPCNASGRLFTSGV